MNTSTASRSEHLDSGKKTCTNADIERMLWGAADLFRGVMHVSEYTPYVQSLLILKHASDLHDDHLRRTTEHRKETTGSMNERLIFSLPETSHWRFIQESGDTIATAISQSIEDLRAANPETLCDALPQLDWTVRGHLSPLKLHEIIERFSSCVLGLDSIESQTLAQSIDWFNERVADTDRYVAGKQYTPQSLASLMAQLMKPIHEETIYDPACGTGGLLLAAAKVQMGNGNGTGATGGIYGQDINPEQVSLTRMNLLLHGVREFTIALGDSLMRPAFTEHGRLRRFDCIATHPPVGQRAWGRDQWVGDPFGRDFAGLPPLRSGDLAWVLHIVQSLDDSRGRAVIVLPTGALSRQGPEASIRMKLMRMDLIEAVVNLPPGLIYGTSIPFSLVVLRKNKPPNRKGRYLLIDASMLSKRGRVRNDLSQEHLSAIVALYGQFQQHEGTDRDTLRADLLSTETGDLIVAPYREIETRFRISLLENGLHSLERGIRAFETYPRRRDPMLLKDSVMFLHHGVELLLKHILAQHSEYLILEDLRRATEDQLKANKQKVALFSLDRPPKTVTYLDAIQRVSAFVSSPELNDELVAELQTLNRYRNQLEHYAIDADIDDLVQLFSRIRDPLIELLATRVPEAYQRLSGKLSDDWRKLNKRAAEREPFEVQVIEILEKLGGRTVPGHHFGSRTDVTIPRFRTVSAGMSIAGVDGSPIRPDIIGQAESVTWLVEVKTVVDRLTTEVADSALSQLLHHQSNIQTSSVIWLVSPKHADADVNKRAEERGALLTTGTEWGPLLELAMKSSS